MTQTDKRRQELILENTGEVHTVPSPPTLQWGDPGFLATDIMIGELCINKVDNKVYTRTSSGIIEINPTPPTPSAETIYKVLESDGTSTNNVLVVASDGTNTFEFTADSASIYIIECWINFTTSGSSGVILNISTVGTTTSSFSIIGSNNSSSAVRYQVINYNTSSASFAAFTSTETAYVHMQGSLITPGTGGLVQIRYRDNNAGQYVNAVKGSWMRVKQIK